MPTTLAIVGIIAGSVSVILGFLALFLSVIFFVKGRNTEKAVSNTLTEIRTQTQILQKITARQIDRFTKYFTEQKPQGADDTAQLISILAQLPNQLTSHLSETSQTGDFEVLMDDFIICCAVLYFYTAQTNYWCQSYLPSASEFDENNDFHKLTMRIVDMSAADFNLIANVLSKQDSSRIQKDSVSYELMNETITYWRDTVKSSSQVFVEREK